MEASLGSWKKLRPDDPELIEAEADLLLEHGQGRTDAERALQLLTPAVEHFPYHAGLRFSLADAYRRLGRTSLNRAGESLLSSPRTGNSITWLGRGPR